MKNRFTYIQFAGKNELRLNNRPNKGRVETEDNGIRKFSHKLIIGLGVALIVLLAGIQVTLSARLATSGKRIKELEETKAQLLLDINQVQLSIAEASSLPVIEARAKNEFGMVKSSNQKDVIVYVDELELGVLAIKR
jgi:hypothetical protein